LWAVKHGGPETKGLNELQRLAASGRTSFPADKDVQKALYRAVGYRVCGERAVRVDILERLADLIRPALGWHEGSPGGKPAGAFGDSSFTVTQAMTSLTGSSGDDFASILRALGYRMEKRPKPVETESSVATEPAEAAGAPVGAASNEAAAAEAANVVAVTTDAPIVPDCGVAGSAAEKDATIAPATETEATTPAIAPADAPPQGDLAIEVSAAEVSAAPASTPEPQFIEVWRLGRSGERRGPRRNRRASERSAGKPAGEAAAAAPPDEAQPAVQAQPSEERRGDRRERPRRNRGEQDRRIDRPDTSDRPAKFGRSDRPRRRQDDRPVRSWVSANDSRGKEPDPNSPFAKLAALKAQLEANAKEPR